MFSTSPFQDDFLHRFARLSTNVRIRVVPADEDPRLTNDAIAYSSQPPPQQSHDIFPPLQLDSDSVAPSVILSSTAYTYADVLKFSRTTGLNLPLEVRELVWEAYLRADGAFSSGSIMIRNCVYQNEKPECPHFLPRICFLSKSTRDETVGVFMRNSSYFISSFNDNVFLRKFIASVKDSELNIRELYFRNFDFFPEYDRLSGAWILENSDLELAVHCKGLRTVHLTMGARFLGQYHFKEGILHGVFHPESVERLVSKYHLRRLLDCEKLRAIHWHGLHMRPGHDQVLQGLAEWVKVKFASQGHKTVYTIT